MLPLFYNKQCLACHGSPKGQIDISGYEKEGFKDGDLGGAISITLPFQRKVAKGNEGIGHDFGKLSGSGQYLPTFLSGSQ